MVGRIHMNDLPYLILGTLIVFYLCTHSANIEYDSLSYIQFSSNRPMLYPHFIWLFHWAGSYQYTLIIWTQGIFLFTTLLYARYWLRTKLNVSEFPIFLTCLFVILTIGFHYQIWYVQSEGLSFPLFILTFFALIESLKKFSLFKLLYLSFLVNVLVLTRLQFYFLYAIFVLLIMWYFWQRVPIQHIFYGALILFGSLIITLLIDHSYHYLKHGTFSGASYGGLMVLVQTIYLANDNASSYFEAPTERAYVQNMVDVRNAKHLNQDAELVESMKPSYLQHAYQAYARNYLAIQDIIDNTLNTSVEKSIDAQANNEANIMALKIDKVIVLHELKKNISFLIWKFVQCIGGIPLLLFFIILIVGIPFQIVKEQIRDPDLSSLFVIVATIITLFNAAMIAICNPDLPAYFCYSQFMFYCLAAFLVSRLSYVAT